MLSTIKRKPIMSRRILVPLTLLIIAAILFLTLGHKYLFSSSAGTKSGSINYSPASPQTNIPNDQRKGGSSTGTVGTTTQDSGKSSIAPTLNAPSTAPPFSVTVSRASHTITNGHDAISVAATINGGSATGTCTFTVSSADGQGQSITQSESSALSSATYYCPGLNITTPKGSWNVSVTVTSNGQSANSAWVNNPVTF